MSAANQHSGVGHWLWQRISSLALIPFTLWLIWAGLQLSAAGFSEAQAFFSSIVQAAMAVLMTALVAFHAQTGIQVICEDYIPQPWQSLLIWTTRIACTAGLLAMIWAMMSISGGASL